jgi:hypothetical protein
MSTPQGAGPSSSPSQFEAPGVTKSEPDIFGATGVNSYLNTPSNYPDAEFLEDSDSAIEFLCHIDASGVRTDAQGSVTGGALDLSVVSSSDTVQLASFQALNNAIVTGTTVENPNLVLLPVGMLALHVVSVTFINFFNFTAFLNHLYFRMLVLFLICISFA